MASEFGAKHLVLAAVALVVGLAVGGLGPRSEVRTLRAQVRELKERECGSPSRVGREIASVFQGRPWEDDLPEAPAPAPAPVAAPGPAPEPSGGVQIRVGDDEVVAEDDEQLEESLEMVREAMDLRRAQARQALVEAGADEAQLQQIDAAVQDMNADLAALADDFVATIREFGEPDRRETMLFARDTLDVLLEAEDALWNAMSDDQRQAMDDAALDPFSYIDGGVVETFMELDP
jgi:hypothetical protein